MAYLKDKYSQWGSKKKDDEEEEESKKKTKYLKDRYPNLIKKEPEPEPEEEKKEGFFSKVKKKVSEVFKTKEDREADQEATDRLQPTPVPTQKRAEGYEFETAGDEVEFKTAPEQGFKTAPTDQLIFEKKKEDKLERIGRILKSGTKTLPSSFKIGGGVTMEAFARQLSSIPGTAFLPQPKTKKLEFVKKIEEKGKEFRTEGFEEFQKIRMEEESNIQFSEGLEGYLEMAAYNLPQLGTSFALTVATTLATKNPALGVAVGLSYGYSLGASEIYSEAVSHGLSDEEALPLAVYGGYVMTGLEYFGLENLAGEVASKQLRKSLVKNLFLLMTKQGIFEAQEEGTQQLFQNWVAKSYDENRDLFEGVPESVIVGGILGVFGAGVTGSVTSIISVLDRKASMEDVDYVVAEQIYDTINTPEEERTPAQKETVRILDEEIELTPEEKAPAIPTTRLSAFGGAEVELPVAKAVEATFDEGSASSGFHESLNQKWTIVYKEPSQKLLNSAKKAGLEISTREAPKGSGQIFTDVSLPNVTVEQIDKATEVFNSFADIYAGEKVVTQKEKKPTLESTTERDEGGKEAKSEVVDIKTVSLKSIPKNKFTIEPKLDIDSGYGASKLEKVASDYKKGNIRPIEITQEKGKYILTDGRARYEYSQKNDIDWPVRIRNFDVQRAKGGEDLAKRQNVTTLAGRTTPLPEGIRLDSSIKAANDIKKIDEWLVEQAQIESHVKKDDYNANIFKELNSKKLTPADRTNINQYLFGKNELIIEPTKPSKPTRKPKKKKKVRKVKKKTEKPVSLARRVKEAKKKDRLFEIKVTQEEKPEKQIAEGLGIIEGKDISPTVVGVDAIKLEKGYTVQTVDRKTFVGKMEFKTLVENSPEFAETPYLTVVRDKKSFSGRALSFKGKDVEFKIYPSSVNLFVDALKVGDVIKVDIDSLKSSPRRFQMRVYKKGGKGMYKALASTDRFADVQSVAKALSQHKTVPFPEILQMVRELTGEIPSVSYPRMRKIGRPLGLFKGVGEGKIILNPDIFRSPEQAVKTFAHEVGHLADWLPTKSLKRGNLIGHVASLNSFLRNNFSGIATEARIDALVSESKEDGLPRGRKAEIKREIAELRKNPEFTLMQIGEELRELTQLWKPFNEEEATESYIEYRYSSAEMYADAISVLFNDPALARKTAPIFYKTFFNTLDRKPKVKKVYFDMQDLLNKGKDAVLSERQKRIRESFKKGEDINRVNEEEARVEKYDFKTKIKTEISNKNQVMIDRVERAEKEGLTISSEENPKYWMEESNYVGGKVKAWVEKNIQPLYLEIQESGVATWDDLGEVLLLERIIKERGGTKNPVKLLRKMDQDLVEGGFEKFVQDNKNKLPKKYQGLSSKQFMNGIEKLSSDKQLEMLETIFKDVVDENGNSAYDQLIARLPKGIANPFGFDVETATEQLDYLYEKIGGDGYAVIENVLPKYRKAIKKLIPEAFKAQLYSGKLTKEIIANEGYATFQVLDYLDSYIPASIRRQVGTLKDVSNPATATVQKSISIVRAIERNKTSLSLVKFLKQNNPNDIENARTVWIETSRSKMPVDPKNKKDLKLVRLMENGKLKGYYVDPYIANSFGLLDTGQINAIIKGLRFFNSGLWRPLFTVYSIRFQTKNFFRDFSRYYKNTPNLSLGRAFKSYAKSVPASVRRAWGISDKIINEMDNKKIFSGFTYGDLLRGVDPRESQIERTIRKSGLSVFEGKQRSRIKKTVLWLPEFIAKFGNMIETLPKVAAYQELQGKMPDKELASFIRNNVGTPDLLKSGTATPLTNNILLFSNPMVQGLVADYKIATNPKTRSGWMFKTFMTAILPKLLMKAAALGLFGTLLKELFDKTSEYDKTNYTIIPLGKDENGEAIILRIPQDETGRMMGGFLWKIMNTVEDWKLSVKDVTELFSYLGGDVPGVTPTISNLVAISQYVSGRNPYDAYRGRYAIPDQEFKAGKENIKYSLKPFMTWLFKQSGGNMFFNFGATYQAPESGTWLQDVYKIPVAGEVVESWIKTTSYGETESEYKKQGKEESLAAIQNLEEREIVKGLAEQYFEEGGEVKDYQNKIKSLVYPDEKTLDSKEKANITRLKTDLNEEILKREGDLRTKNILRLRLNTSKIDYIKREKEKMKKEEYEAWIKMLKNKKIISDTVYKEVKKF